MESDGYSLDDNRNKQEGYGDLQDIIARYQNRNPAKDTDRTQKCFVVSYADIEEGYDLSLSRYKEVVFEEIEYEAPEVILERLIQSEVGDFSNKNLAKINSGILKDLLELREMIG